jgi:hypothetical protein
MTDKVVWDSQRIVPLDFSHRQAFVKLASIFSAQLYYSIFFGDDGFSVQLYFSLTKDEVM